MKVVAFDLDNTLYSETDYRLGAYWSLAQRLAQDFNVPREQAFEQLKKTYYEFGDRAVFQKALEGLGLSDANVERYVLDVLVPGYRTWNGDLKPYPSVVPVLRELRRRGFGLGLITNGGSATQWNKIGLLGIKGYFDVILVTGDHLPKNRWKPHPAPFQLCFSEFDASYEQCVYVGDNPQLDVPGAEALGVHVFIVGSVDLQKVGEDSSYTVIRDLSCLLEIL